MINASVDRDIIQTINHTYLIYMKYNKKIPALIIAISIVFTFALAPQITDAQSAQNQCQEPDFSISSSNSVLAIAGSNFSYFVVSDGDASYQLDSPLPSGLQYSNGQISGTPTSQSVGEYTLQFSATNSCGTTTDSIVLTILNSDGTMSATTNDNTIAQAEDGSGDQSAAAGTVGLNEIPETGIVADTALTVGFYLLALLLVAVLFGRRLRFAVSSGGDDVSDMSVIPSFESRYSSFSSQKRTESRSRSRRFGDGIRR